MTFTDDDLKRLKSGAYDPRLIQTVEQVQALLARLEAAEELNFRMWAYHRGQGDDVDFEQALKSWRKLAGK